MSEFRVTVRVVLLVAVAVMLIASSNAVASPSVSEWSTPTTLGPIVNSAFVDAGPAISKDGLSVYFNSVRPGGLGLFDIWVSQRATQDDAWGSYREHVHDDFAWETAVNLGPGVNSASNDAGASYFENDELGVPLLYYGSDRPVGLLVYDIYVSAQLPDGSWGAPELVTELSTSASDQRPSLRFGGLETSFFSNRPGGVGQEDVWISTRDSTPDPWTTPVNLGAGVNRPQDDRQAYIASDRKTLFFASTRPGGFGAFDLYMTTRAR